MNNVDVSLIRMDIPTVLGCKFMPFDLELFFSFIIAHENNGILFSQFTDFLEAHFKTSSHTKFTVLVQSLATKYRIVLYSRHDKNAPTNNKVKYFLDDYHSNLFKIKTKPIDVCKVHSGSKRGILKGKGGSFNHPNCSLKFHQTYVPSGTRRKYYGRKNQKDKTKVFDKRPETTQSSYTKSSSVIGDVPDIDDFTMDFDFSGDIEIDVGDMLDFSFSDPLLLNNVGDTNHITGDMPLIV